MVRFATHIKGGGFDIRFECEGERGGERGVRVRAAVAGCASSGRDPTLCLADWCSNLVVPFKALWLCGITVDGGMPWPTPLLYRVCPWNESE